MLSTAGLAGAKRDRPVPWSLLERHAEGLICLTGCRDGVVAAAARRGDRDATLAAARRLKDIFGPDRCYVEIQRHLDQGDARLGATLAGLGEHLGLGLVATNNVHYARPDGFRLQHVLACIREHAALDDAGTRLYATPHRYLKGAAEMRALFPDLPAAVAAGSRIAERCNLTLDLSHARLAAFPVPEGETPFGHLLALAYAGLRRRFRPVTPEATAQLARELGVIERRGLAEYFLLVHDIVAHARAAGILCQGRGSAAGSIVAYVLDITPVDPLAHDLLFDRFLADDSKATPDIDVDFAADRREEVIQYVYRRYGAEHTAMVANVVTFQARSAVADVGKALGFPADLLADVRKHLHTRSAHDIAPDLSEVESFAGRLTYLPWQLLLDLCRQIDGCPRHLSIHVGGMIVTRTPLAELVPLEPATMPGRVVVQWDKDDVEDAGLIKIDLLSLRTLGLVAECLDLVRAAGGPDITWPDVPADDPEVWRMLTAADTIGCFQVESRAQMNLQPRFRPTGMADVIIEVALIRPGPIQGGMAKAYLARRDSAEPVTYWHPSLESVLAETLGIVVFQEQVLRVAMAIAGFSGGEADALRRAMSRKRSYQAMEQQRAAFVAGARARGVDAATADDVFDHLLGFASYGFCKSHAAAFAQLTYVTAWLKCHHPHAFYCALLNAQPMGFYSVETVVEDARRHGILPLALDVNRSAVTWAIEGDHLRVPLTRLKGIRTDTAAAIVAARAAGPFTDLWDFVRRARPPRATAERLIRAGALDALPAPPDRRDLLWALGEMHWDEGALDLPPVATPAALPATTVAEVVAADYGLVGLAQGPHLVALVRPALAERGVLTSAELGELPHGVRAAVAGRLEVLQRPPAAKGIAFASIEDEFGLVNLLFYPDAYQQNRRALRVAPVIIAEGTVQRDHGALHLVTDRVVPVAMTDPDADDGPPPYDLPPPGKDLR
jgi:error-prone DNA polymerase